MDERRRGQWMNAAALVVALLAALSLAVTVAVARAELASASQALVRGEGESLAARLHEGGRLHGGPPSPAFLNRQLEELRPLGLRSITITTPHASIVVGEARFPAASPSFSERPGHMIVRGQRALLVTRLPPPLPGPPHERGPGWLPPPGAPPPPDDAPPRASAPGPSPGPPEWPAGEAAEKGPVLTIEYEPWVLAQGSVGMDRTVAVASGAVLVLLAFAGALSARVVGRARSERRAEHARRLAALGQMAGVLAHELRNPLASLKGHTQLLAESLESGTRAHAKATLVVSEAVRLEGLTRDLLAFVRDGELSPRSIAPAELLARALQDVPAERLVLDLSAAPPALVVDEVRLSAALRNLVRNALEVSPPAAPVTLAFATHAPSGDVVITVADEGPGISEEDRERVFEPFFTKNLHGTGLGLAVARRAVEDHGGTLVVDGGVPRGAIFRIRLPAVASRRDPAIGSGSETEMR
jgi:two-component system, NtrC family, sensor histidine kinase HydH